MKALIDTNVLIYAADPRDGQKHLAAQGVLESLHSSRSGALSSQALAEFASVTTRKMGRSYGEALKQVEALTHAWPVIDLTAAIVLEALRGARDHRLSYFDAQMWATARLSQIPILLSEDFRSGTTLEGVQFVNPFAPGFSIEQWG